MWQLLQNYDRVTVAYADMSVRPGRYSSNVMKTVTTMRAYKRYCSCFARYSKAIDHMTHEAWVNTYTHDLNAC